MEPSSLIPALFGFIAGLGIGVVTCISVAQFNLTKTKQAKRMPCVGEIWRLRPDGSPWSKVEPRAQIIDVQDGWVRYKFVDFSDSDHRLRLEIFTSIYRCEGSQ